MDLLASTSGDVLDYALALFFVASGLGLAYMLFRLGGTFQRLSSFIRGTERELLPVIEKSGGTVDRVNRELDKLDTVTDSAVSMASSADTAVRAVSTAITTPVKKVTGFSAGRVARSLRVPLATECERSHERREGGRPPARGGARRGAEARWDRRRSGC